MPWKSLDKFLTDTEQHLPEFDSERWVSYNISDLYPLWQEKAHCKGVGHDYYFGTEEDEMPDRIRLTRNAAKLCDVCPVFQECLRHALTVREEFGVWAGTSGRARRKLFVQIDTGVATIDEIIEVTASGRGRGQAPVADSRRDPRWRDRQAPSGPSLRDEDGGELAL